MQAGIIANVAGEFSRVDPLRKRRIEDGTELTDQIEVTGVQRKSGEIDFDEGHAAREELAAGRRIQLSNSEISVQDDPRVTTRYTEFAAVPGSFVLVGSKRGSFLFDLLESTTDTVINRATIDLGGFMDQFDTITPWKVGFYDATNNAEKGTLYGEDVLSAEVGHLLDDALFNQLGAVVEYGDSEFKLTITESGYVGIHRPSGLDTVDFLTFIDETVEPFLG